MTSTLVCTFALLSVGLIFSLPIEPDFTSTSFPVHAVEGHLSRGFTDEFGLFTSTLNTPFFDETTSRAERELLPEENTEMTSIDAEQTKRGLDETEVEGTSTDASVHEERTLRLSHTDPTMELGASDVATRAHHEDEEEEEEEHTTKKTGQVEKEDSSVESEEGATTLSGRLAEFDPTVFDSVSTPAGTQLQFDENRQSIDRLSTEESANTTETAVEEEKQEKRLTLVQLNQGQNSSLVEEKKSNH